MSLSTLINDNLTPVSPDKITAAELRTVLLELDRRQAQHVDYGTSIPFDSNNTTIAATTLTANSVFTPNLTNAIEGAVSSLRLTGDGSHTPDLTAFKKREGSLEYSMSAGVVNRIIFDYDGVDVWMTVTRQAVGSDISAPVVSSRTTLNATTIRVIFNEAVTTSGVTGHSFRKNGSTLTPTAVSGSGTNTLDFTVPTMIFGDVIDHSYDSSTGDTKDTSNNELASLINASVSNSLSAGGDTTAPTVFSAAVQNANSIRIVFSEPTTATLAGWSFKKNGGTLTPSSVNTINSTTVDFIVPSIIAGDTIVRSYNSATGDTKDTYNNELVSFVDQAVSNGLTADSTAPTVSAMSVLDATHIRIVFSEPINSYVEGISGTMGGFTFKKNGSAYLATTYTGGSGSPTTDTLDFTMPSAMISGDAILASYNASIGNVADPTGNALVSFTDQVVTNGLVPLTLATAAWRQRFDPRLTSKLELTTSGSDQFVKTMLDIQHGGTILVPNDNYDLQSSPGVPANRPKYLPTGLNGQACIEFTVGTVLTNGQWPAGQEVLSPFTRFAVVEFLELLDGKYALSSVGGDPGNFLFYSGKFAMYAGALLDFTGITPAINTKYLIWLEFNGSSSKGRINGVQYASGNAGTPTFGYAGSLLGGPNGGHYKIADTGFYPGLFSTADRDSLEAELKTKHGIS